ncbi:HK97 gp10 family phage protein [Devosia sp. YIM 151766]|uniref:HK97 gp10 family phage protein n=1 Tax=Devosia sp. YIM 151766 TaxID=3017325 RepID=UPI00255C3477|nr:HK97 gp10 family phage protein [Devosia sp. YIM 151766]WIY54152.1 HK97 gp10 family phage protein [Devosia sp. YIM 151766]
MDSFSATIGSWCERVPEAIEAVLRGSAQDLVKEMQAELNRLVYEAPPSPSGYQRTGFLRASLVASTSAMPQLIRDNPGAPVSADEMTGIILVINGWDGGGTLYLGYTAKYGAQVHFGANGTVPKPWVTLAAQRWPVIVKEEAAKVKAAFGL